jgi:hypothetical protein
MAKGMSAACAPISIHEHSLHLVVSYLAPTSSPTLKDLSFAARAVFGAIFIFSLDIWQFQDNNGHRQAPAMVVSQLPTCMELAISFNTNHFWDSHTFL